MRLATLALIGAMTLTAHGQSFKDYQREANACFRAKDYACAIKGLKKALKAEPEHPDAAVAWSDMGTSLRRIGKAEEALKAYDKALEIAPGNTSILKNRASLKRNMSDLVGSLADYDRVLELDPKNSDAYMERSGTRALMGDKAGEEADLLKAVEVDPANYKAATNLALFKKRAGRLDESKADLDRIVAAHPTQAVPWNNRADILLVMGGDLDQAMHDIAKAIELDPAYGIAFVTKAEIELAQGKKPEARKDLERAVELGEDRKALADLFAKCE